jgi:P-type Cu+ transporter
VQSGILNTLWDEPSSVTPSSESLIADEVRPSARPAVKALEKMNIRVVLLTGDSAEVAEDLANQLGIITFRSDLLPEDKSAAIARQVRKTER